MKSGVALMTFNSAFLFCMLAILISAFPSVISGSVADAFHSFDMLTIISTLLGCYFLPLWLYLAGSHIMKYVLATFCGVGLLMVSFIIISILYAVNTIHFLAVFILAIMTFITNTMWYVAAFRRISGGYNINE